MRLEHVLLIDKIRDLNQFFQYFLYESVYAGGVGAHFFPFIRINLATVILSLTQLRLYTNVDAEFFFG